MADQSPSQVTAAQSHLQLWGLLSWARSPLLCRASPRGGRLQPERGAQTPARMPAAKRRSRCLPGSACGRGRPRPALQRLLLSPPVQQRIWSRGSAAQHQPTLPPAQQETAAVLARPSAGLIAGEAAGQSKRGGPSPLAQDCSRSPAATLSGPDMHRPSGSPAAGMQATRPAAHGQARIGATCPSLLPQPFLTVSSMLGLLNANKARARGRRSISGRHRPGRSLVGCRTAVSVQAGLRSPCCSIAGWCSVPSSDAPMVAQASGACLKCSMSVR